MSETISAGLVSLNLALGARVFAAPLDFIPEWAKWVGGFAVFLGSMKVILNFFRGMARLSSDIDRALPVLREVASQFGDNTGHSTLKQQLDDIKTAAAANAEKLDELHTYSHNARHERINQLTGVGWRLEAIERALGLDPDERTP